jgi:hypothetical protein
MMFQARRDLQRIFSDLDHGRFAFAAKAVDGAGVTAEAVAALDTRGLEVAQRPQIHGCSSLGPCDMRDMQMC